MDNLTAGNPLAHRVRVYYEGSNTIYQGMLLNYNHDTTTNWSGGSVSVGVVTVSSTTAEGSQNEGKYIRVEEPSVANKRFPAGVVAPGGWCGRTGPGVVDVYVPNGAIVPVRTDKSVSINDRAYSEAGQNTVINTPNGPCIGYFVETIDRSSTAGLALCKLQQPALVEEELSTLGVGLSPLLWDSAPDIKDPGLGVSFFDDFTGPIDPTATAGGWTLTLTDTKGSINHEAGAPGGVLQFTSATGDSADDGIQGQLTNCCVLPAAGTDVWFEARVKVSQADEQWAIGLCAVDTTVIAAGIFDDVSDKVLFGHHTGTADKINTITARTSAQDETADVAAMTDDTWVTVGFKITGITTVDFYVNGALVESGAVTANVPNAAMCLTAVAQYEAADTILSIDWVKIVASGGRDA